MRLCRAVVSRVSKTYLIRQIPWTESQVSANNFSTQSSLLLRAMREAPQAGHIFIRAILRNSRCVEATKVAWLQVRGETETGSPVRGLICSARSPEGRAWSETHFKILKNAEVAGDGDLDNAAIIREKV